MAVRKKKKGGFPPRPEDQNPGVAKAIERAGSQKQLAEMMGVDQPLITHWLYRSCPPVRAKQIEEKLGVSRKEICPEIFG